MTTAYTTYDPATGRILVSAIGDILGFPEGEAYVEGIPPQDGQRYVVRDGAFVVDDRPLPRAPYQERRLAAYPSVGEQLDALWHAMDAGLLPKVPGFFDPIAAVKAAHPKE